MKEKITLEVSEELRKMAIDVARLNGVHIDNIEKVLEKALRTGLAHELTLAEEDARWRMAMQLEERVAAIEKALVTLSNTLHVVDAAALLSVNSLIKSDNLHPLTFTSNQEIIDSGCSKAIEDALTNANLVFKNERNHAKENKSKRR